MPRITSTHRTDPTSHRRNKLRPQWSHFAHSPCALTVVKTKGLALLESIIEINIFGIRDGGKIKKQVIEHKPSSAMRLGPAAVGAGDLLCLSALYAVDENGVIPVVQKSAGLHYLGAPAQHQMRAILSAAEDICRSGLKCWILTGPCAAPSIIEKAPENS